MSAQAHTPTGPISMESGACEETDVPPLLGRDTTVVRVLWDDEAELPIIQPPFAALETLQRSAGRRLIWTPLLHKRFEEALQVLGEVAVPRKIRITMNARGVTRSNVASHLQKHRMAYNAGQRRRGRKKERRIVNFQPIYKRVRIDLSLTPAMAIVGNQGFFQRKRLRPSAEAHAVSSRTSAFPGGTPNRLMRSRSDGSLKGPNSDDCIIRPTTDKLPSVYDKLSTNASAPLPPIPPVPTHVAAAPPTTTTSSSVGRQRHHNQHHHHLQYGHHAMRDSPTRSPSPPEDGVPAAYHRLPGTETSLPHATSGSASTAFAPVRSVGGGARGKLPSIEAFQASSSATTTTTTASSSTSSSMAQSLHAPYMMQSRVPVKYGSTASSALHSTAYPHAAYGGSSTGDHVSSSVSPMVMASPTRYDTEPSDAVAASRCRYQDPSFVGSPGAEKEAAAMLLLSVHDDHYQRLPSKPVLWCAESSSS